MKIKTLAGLVVSLMISGCTTFTQYKSPAEGPTAIMDFPFYGVSFTHTEGSEYVLIGNSSNCDELSKSKEHWNVSVTAGSPLIIQHGIRPGAFLSGCHIRYKFTPKPDTKYISELILYEKYCQIEILEVLPDRTKQKIQNFEVLSCR